jgi:hypothetical protein
MKAGSCQYGQFLAVPLLAYLTVSYPGLLVAGLSHQRLGFATTSVHVRFLAEKVSTGQTFLQYFVVPLSIRFYSCPILTHESRGRWINDPLRAKFHRSTRSTHRNNSSTRPLRKVLIFVCLFVRLSVCPFMLLLMKHNTLSCSITFVFNHTLQLLPVEVNSDVSLQKSLKLNISDYSVF